AQTPPVLEQATLLSAARPLPSLTLTDHAGRDFGRDRLLGHWTLMFFGFTHCPDVCPTTLATLAQARKLLADLPLSDRPAIVLVSVDPARDTPDALAQYVGHFDAEFVGVTGRPAAIEVLTRELGVAVLAGVPADDGSYTVDHTAAIFLIDASASFAAVFGGSHAADLIARDYRRIVAFRR
ncbi:MAG: SCO family protein, partial [Gemmatimonadetes bacterium]|nr:SCO family protein [Gemmatimonadota bacterium]